VLLPRHHQQYLLTLEPVFIVPIHTAQQTTTQKIVYFSSGIARALGTHQLGRCLCAYVMHLAAHVF